MLLRAAQLAISQLLPELVLGIDQVTDARHDLLVVHTPTVNPRPPCCCPGAGLHDHEGAVRMRTSRGVSGVRKAWRGVASSVMASAWWGRRGMKGWISRADLVSFQVAFHWPSMRRLPWVEPLPGGSGTGRSCGMTRLRSA